MLDTAALPAVPPWLVWSAALGATLVLAAWCTPRAWWRRPNLRALAVLAGGTLGVGLLFGALLPAARSPGPAEPLAAMAAPGPAGASGMRPVLTPATAPGMAPAAAPAPGARYRVVADLNLRAERGVRAERMRVLAAGTIVRATGATDGDWWRVQATLGGRAVDGWASSLWLRRADEAPAGR